MGLQRDESGRLHIDTELMAESLMDKDLLKRTEAEKVFRPLPTLNVLKLGGQSIIDRGAKAVLPLLDEIKAAVGVHKMLVLTGGGTRSRHAYAIALDLGMPAGVLAKLGSSISEQNALMISILLAPHGGVKIGHDDLTRALGGENPGTRIYREDLPSMALSFDPLNYLSEYVLA